MFFANCIFKNVILLFFLLIYDIIKIIVMKCFLLITYLRITCFLLFLRIRNNYDDIFLIIAYLRMTYFMYILLYHLYQSSIKIIRITSPFNKILVFVFSNNFFNNIYMRSIFGFLQFSFIENTFYYFIIQIFNFISYYI